MGTDSLKTFFGNIASLRKHYGYSKKHMAQILGISIGTLNKIEAGITPPRLSIEVVLAVSRFFHIQPSVLFSQLLFAKLQ